MDDPVTPAVAPLPVAALPDPTPEVLDNVPVDEPEVPEFISAVDPEPVPPAGAGAVFPPQPATARMAMRTAFVRRFEAMAGRMRT